MSKIELTILMPSLNESATIAKCIRKARGFLDREGIHGEVLVADNDSTDGSQSIAEQSGARVIHVEQKGYGSALLGGIQAARGTFVIMGDADDSYDFANLKPFVDRLREGYDLVMGNRFKGGIAPDAMPFLHRYLGNPVLTWLGKILFHSPCGDIYCGLRGFKRESILDLDLRTTGMEFAIEMIVKAPLRGMKITEVPTMLSPDGRSRPPHLLTWRDGWRSLRFLILYSPTWLFLYPGFVLMALGIIGGSVLIFGGPLKIGSVYLDIHSLLLSSLLVILGFQSISFAFMSKLFAITEKLLPQSRRFTKLFRFFTLEKGLITGFIEVFFGFAGIAYAVILWGERSFGELNASQMMRVVIPAFTFLALGVQTILTSFLLSFIGLKRR